MTVPVSGSRRALTSVLDQLSLLCDPFPVTGTLVEAIRCHLHAGDFGSGNRYALTDRRIHGLGYGRLLDIRAGHLSYVGTESQFTDMRRHGRSALEGWSKDAPGCPRYRGNPQ